ncbi:ankyrin repeat domain-containing protein [Actinoplanes sp. NPDC049802]|uniref:ankyrin repeat domain-containing protein n=1 Tax=Actinoplanes sp. NPDC049802 TaxID=3154742 RepID=UPI0033CC60B9
MSGAWREWQRIRRYAVPQRMIDECAEARERGDWRAACAAGRVDVAIGDAVMAQVEDQLAGFAPDLLRWHLPREAGGFTTLARRRRYLLIPDRPAGDDPTTLVVESPISRDGSQRLTLRAMDDADIDHQWSHPVPAYLWDARHAAQFRAAVGGSADRLPWFTSAGDPLPPHSFGMGTDEPARAERARSALGPAEALAVAGISVSAEDTWRSSELYDDLTSIDLLRLRYEIRWLAARQRGTKWAVPFGYWCYLSVDADGEDVRVTMRGGLANHPVDRALPRLSLSLARFSPDLDLVWHGLSTPADLHPLVRLALFPSAATAAPPAAATPASDRFRVRCRGVWHEIKMRDGRLDLPEHSEAEQQRERTLRALGGTVTGCFAVEQTWTGARGRLPKKLHAHRDDLWQRITHGGTRVLWEMLDAGLNPHLRDGRGRTLIHRARSFDHARLLPRLLAAGVDVNAKDVEGSTALYLAVVHRWPADLIIALVDAGADLHTPNQYGETVLGRLEDHFQLAEDYEQEVEPDFQVAADYLRGRA